MTFPLRVSRLVRLAKIFRLMKMSSVFQKIRLVLTSMEDKLKIKVVLPACLRGARPGVVLGIGT